MSAITDYMFEVDFIEEVYAHLFKTLNLHAVVLDSDGMPAVANSRQLPGAWQVRRFYPFDSPNSIGGLQCSAADKAALQSGDPHVRLCLKALQGILVREVEMQEMTNEMLDLSTHLHVLLGIAKKIVGITQTDHFCQIILEEISLAVQADQGFLRLVAEPDHTKDAIALHMSQEDLRQIEEHEFFHQAKRDETIILNLEDGRSALVAPIRGHDTLLGHMVFSRQKEKRFFTSYEKKFVAIIENIISPSVQAILLCDNLQEQNLNTIKALAAAIDAKDEYTHGHSARVAKYSLAIARQLHLDDKMLHDLEVAAYMHDLGKIGIAESVLSKPGRLTDAEFDHIKEHPTLTSKILEPIKLAEVIVEGAVMHHERLDGSGYPSGRKGHEIPLFARIVAVADVYDALTSCRPYRDAMAIDKALTIIRAETPNHFDADIVGALISSLGAERGEAVPTRLPFTTVSRSMAAP